VDFRAREEVGCFPSVALAFPFGGGRLLSDESDEIEMISSSEGLGFAVGAGGLPSLLDQALDEELLKDLIRCDEGPAWDVDGVELAGAAAFCNEVEGGEDLPAKNLRNVVSVGGDMDEDGVGPAEIAVPALEGFKLEGPGMEDGSFSSTIIFRGLDECKMSSLDTPSAEILPMPPSVLTFGTVPKSQPPPFLRGLLIVGAVFFKSATTAIASSRLFAFRQQ